MAAAASATPICRPIHHKPGRASGIVVLLKLFAGWLTGLGFGSPIRLMFRPLFVVVGGGVGSAARRLGS